MFSGESRRILFTGSSVDSSPSNNPHQSSFDAAKAAEKSNPRRLFNLKFTDKDRKSDKAVSFFVFGCHGSGKEAQKQVAELLAKWAKNPEERPDFVLLLGDNFYDFGVDSPDHVYFKKLFYDMYAKLREMGIPCFALPGNHDGNWHKANKLKPWLKVGIDVVNNQVVHSYLPEIVTRVINNTKAAITKVFSIEDKQALYSGDTFVIDPNEAFPFWNMPFRYYSLVADDTQIFCADSNTLISEYLQLLTNPKNKNNQVAWLLEEVIAAKKAGRKVILAQHHPLVTPDKRVYHPDLDIYLTPKEIVDARKIFGFTPDEKVSYNDLLRKLFEKLNEEMLQENSKLEATEITTIPTFDQKATDNESILVLENEKKTVESEQKILETSSMENNSKPFDITSMESGSKPIAPREFSSNFEFDAIFTAHVHAESCYNNNDDDTKKYKIRQWIVGGGGGELHDREYFGQQENMGIFRKVNGFLQVVCRKGSAKIQTYFRSVTPNSDLAFTNSSKTPTRVYSDAEEAEKIKALCDVVKAAIDQYVNFTHLNQHPSKGKWLKFNFSHGQDGVRAVHRLWDYISHQFADNYAVTVEKIYELARWQHIVTKPTEDSFITYLNKQLASNFGIESIEKLYDAKVRRVCFAATLEKLIGIFGNMPNQSSSSSFGFGFNFNLFAKPRNYSADILAATKMRNVLLGTKQETFSPEDIKALRSFELGDVLTKYEKLGALPNEFLSAEMNSGKTETPIFSTYLKNE